MLTAAAHTDPYTNEELLELEKIMGKVVDPGESPSHRLFENMMRYRSALTHLY